jgi:predicted transcriptional regulator
MIVPLEDQPVWLVINNPNRSKSLDYDPKDYLCSDEYGDRKGGPKSTWTEEEVRLLIKLRKDGKTYIEMEGMFNRSRSSLVRKVTHLQQKGILERKKKADWTEEEVSKLLELIKTDLSYWQIGKRLGRSKEGVFKKLKSLREKGVIV